MFFPAIGTIARFGALAAWAPPEFGTFVLLVAQYAGPAILAYFLFVQERRVHKDYVQSSAQSSAQELAHHRRVHTSTIVATYLLIAVCVAVWVVNLFSKRDYIEGEVFGLEERSDPVLVKDEIVPILPDGARFFHRKQGPEGGKTSYTWSWILGGDVGMSQVRFAFQHRFQNPNATAPSTVGGDSAVLVGDPRMQMAPPTASALLSSPRYFVLDIGSLRSSSKSGVKIRYQPGADPAKPGALYFETAGGSTPLKWLDEGSAGRSSGRRMPGSPWHRLLEIAPVYAQGAQDCSQLQPSATELAELTNQLGGPSLATQLAAQKRLEECGSCCVGYMETAVKDPSSALGRERSILVGSLATVIRQFEGRGIRLPDSLYADFGMTNYRMSQFQASLDYLTKLSAGYLGANPQYYFYRGFVRSQLGENVAAITDYQTYLQKAHPLRIGVLRTIIWPWSTTAWEQPRKGEEPGRRRMATTRMQ